MRKVFTSVGVSVLGGVALGLAVIDCCVLWMFTHPDQLIQILGG